MLKNRIAFFTALCMFLSAIEYAVPKPLPFMRLGLANLPVMLSLSKMRVRETFCLVLLKVICQGFISGTLFSYVFLFSLSSSCASAIAMLIVYHAFYTRNLVSFMGVSLSGALFSSIAQITLGKVVLFGENTRFIAPPLLFLSLITACALGAFTNAFVLKSKWFSLLDDVKRR